MMYALDSTIDRREITPEEERLMTLRNEIFSVFNRFSPDDYLVPYRLYESEEGDEVEENLDEALVEVLERYRDIVSVYQVENVCTFEGPSYSTGAIMVAFVNEVTGLETFLEQWEVD